MRLGVLVLSALGGLVIAAPTCAGEKADVDTSPRVFASASGKYWVRVTTKREMRDVNRWTTTMTVSHADGGRKGYADEKVVSETTLDTFPARVLVSDTGVLTVLGHHGAVSLESVITVYGPDGKKRGATEFMEFLEPLAGGGSGSDRARGYEILRYGKGAYYEHDRADLLVIPLPSGREARLNLETGRPVK